MIKPRIIVSFLLSKNGFYKTINFSKPTYIGDPINAIRIFTEKKVDEIIIYDIEASKYEKEPNYNLLRILASETRMPICYGGGIKNIDIAKKIFELGIEKISLNKAIFNNINLLKSLIKQIGSQSIAVTLDVAKNDNDQKYYIYNNYGDDLFKSDFFEFIKKLEDIGIGEIIINNIDLDGTMKGYDISLIRSVYNKITIPSSFIGGASSFKEIKEIANEFKVIGLGAGSLFF